MGLKMPILALICGEKFDPPMRRLLGMIAVVGSALCRVAFLGRFRICTKLYKIGIDAEDIPLPRWIFMSILPIGLGLVFVRFLQIGMRILHGKQDGLILGDETAEAMARHLEEVARDGRADAKAISLHVSFHISVWLKLSLDMRRR